MPREEKARRQLRELMDKEEAAHQAAISECCPESKLRLLQAQSELLDKIEAHLRGPSRPEHK